MAWHDKDSHYHSGGRDLALRNLAGVYADKRDEERFLITKGRPPERNGARRERRGSSVKGAFSVESFRRKRDVKQGVKRERIRSCGAI